MRDHGEEPPCVVLGVSQYVRRRQHRGRRDFLALQQAHQRLVLLGDGPLADESLQHVPILQPPGLCFEPGVSRKLQGAHGVA